ncbi:hypothetical protein [Flavobacterium aciduliphilum]|uniref:Uncharacterized protein n=1 Tax=Flavobacterium aciduliphilum TaxID=1101402 RepID=A0A328YVZ1_9FLAO|nr:hypothetical protein [Flavobacterium aciduliphilum]RAR74246.1 hypothetical protein CLV55_102179 [Flavobacterium aciduliphilum]
MNQTTLIPDTIELIEQFILASENIDTLKIEELLDEDGAYEIEDETLEVNETSKPEFLKWYTTKLKTTKITDVIYDQCIGCSFGKNIVILNHGTFPIIPQEFTDKTKAGLMLDSHNGKIHRIQFCFSFLKTENKAVCECVGEELVKYIKKGFSEEEAVVMYDANPNSQYSYITKKINDNFC